MNGEHLGGGDRAQALAALRRLPLLATIEPARWDALEPSIGFTDLAVGELLFAAGTSSAHLYMVIDGELGLDMPCPRSTTTYRLQSRGAGATAGDFALLNGSRHLVSAIATRSTRVATLPAVALDQLSGIDPSILAHAYDTAAALSRSVMLARLFLDLFDEIPPDRMVQLLSATTVRHYRSGERVFDAGDEVNGLHLLVSGRVLVERAARTDAAAGPIELRAPEIIGERALLGGGRRGASVIAARESTVALLPKAAFDTYVLADAALLGSLTRLLIRRQQQHESRGRGEAIRARHRTFAVVPLIDDERARRALNRLKRALHPGTAPLVLDAAGFDLLYGKPGASSTASGALFDSAVGEWLDDKEERIDALFYVVNDRFDAWTERCVNRADRILLLVDADAADSTPGELERRLAAHFEHVHLSPRIELVLLHPPETREPSRTARWLNARRPAGRLDDFHHVRMDDDAHFARLARRLTGDAHGLVFSGGGARGYAHLGVQRLIEERSIPIDCIGGSSMGALLGAAMAMGHDHDAVCALSTRFASRRALFDYTLPIVSLMRSAKLTRFCREVYGDTRIEDLWTPFFAMSSNLADGKPVLHDRGPLWQVVRSSISLPGLFSPVPTDDGGLLIDGAVLDNFPVDAMLGRLGGLGKLIGVNVSRVPERFERFSFGSQLSGWRVLRSRLSPFHERIAVPRVAETLLRATDIKDLERNSERRTRLDVLVEPDVSRWSLLDFKHFRAISDVGYEAAARVFDTRAALLQPTTGGTRLSRAGRRSEGRKRRAEVHVPGART